MIQDRASQTHSHPHPTHVPTGYCHISNLSDERLPKLDAVYKVGNAVRCRVIGFNLMDGLAHMSARKAVVEQQVCVWGYMCAALIVVIVIIAATLVFSSMPVL
eukprot:1159711-Pelagomonas_calceolata.AAC.13